MNIFHYNISSFNIYVTVNETIYMTIHNSHGDVISCFNESVELNIKNLNIFMLKFILKIVSNDEIKNCDEICILINDITKISGIITKLNHDISKAILIKLFVLIVELFKKIKSLFIIQKLDIVLLLYELIYIKTFLNHLIDN